jgi:chaperonin GroEL
MKRDNLYSGKEAMQGLMEGVKKVSGAVAVTLGSAGKNSLLEAFAAPHYYPTNDGYSIAAAIRLADPLENLGATVLKEAINRANRNSADGSSTTCVLCSAVLEEGMKHLGEASPMDLKRNLEQCIPLIEESLKKQRKELVDKDGNIDFKLLEEVATISAEDESIGKLLAEIYSHIGTTGIVNWAASKDTKDSYEIGTGIKIDGATYASRYMCDAEGDGFTYQATIENPLVLLAKSKITNQSEMGGIDGNGSAYGLLGELVQAGVKDVVIFCDEMDAPILNSFILARAPQALGIRFLVIKMPTVFNDLWWEDLEKASGGRIISPASGIKMKDAKMAYMGKFGKITVTREDTFIDGIKDLTTHLLALKVDGSDEALARAARLNTKTATYFVGAHSDSALRQRRDKVEDAIGSAYSALQNGILPGGGVALLNASKEIKNEILKEALKKPFEQIVKNTGATNLEQIYKFISEATPTHGFDSKTGGVVDMFREGIVDSYDVVFEALKNAIGVAAGILTIGTIVLLPRNENSVDEAIKQIMQTPQ